MKKWIIALVVVFLLFTFSFFIFIKSSPGLPKGYEELPYCEDKTYVDCQCREGVRRKSGCALERPCDRYYICTLNYVEGQLIISFTEDISREEFRRFIKGLGFEVKIEFNNTNTFSVYVPEGEEQEWIIYLELKDFVEAVEVSQPIRLF